jgi:hypothetical protein
LESRIFAIIRLCWRNDEELMELRKELGMNRTLLLLCSVILLCLATTARAANITANSCSSSDVQAAINSAATRDTVIVPPGNCTWTSTVTIASKGITLTGGGIGQTNITDQGSGGAALLVTGASATDFVNIGGFTFIKGTAHPNGIVQINGTLFSVAFRFHHNRILQASSGGRGISVTAVYGLIDHNMIDVTAASGSVQSISIFGASIGSDGGHTPWRQPLTLGTDKAVYVEDNVVTYNTADTGVEDALDAYAGARFVVRYNQINNISMGHHGTDSGSQRSPVSYEVYNNRFTNNSTTKVRGWTVRGGTGVFFNNTYGGTIPTGWNDVTLLNYRACSANGFSWQKCNGTNWELGSTDLSSDLSRTCSTSGGVRFDGTNKETLGSEGGNFTRYFDGSGTGGYPCRDQPGMAPGQAVEPIYFWNNMGVSIGAWNMGDTSNCNGLGIDNYIRSGRDYIDNGTTPKPGYAAYTYPHPLQAGQSNTTPPAAPSGLAVK